MRGACASIPRVAEMRMESGGGVSCGELPENIKNKEREGCDAHRELTWGGRDESRGGLYLAGLSCKMVAGVRERGGAFVSCVVLPKGGSDEEGRGYSGLSRAARI